MGPLQQIFSALSGKTADQTSPMMTVISSLLGSEESGGLGGLVQKLEAAGLGDVVSSWVGRGENQEISPDQLHQALGDDHVTQLAENAGLTKEQLLTQLSEHLPDVVDKLTPGGEIPEGGVANSILGLLKGKFAST
jgi:uncharacterized protein YidB (DUF937 family)